MVDDKNAYDALIIGKYRVFWQIPHEMIHVNSDFTLFLMVEDTSGQIVADSGKGHFFVGQRLSLVDEGVAQSRPWISIFNREFRRYEVYGNFDKPGNWQLEIQFVKDSVDFNFGLPVMVMAETKNMQHQSGGMQGRSGGCH